MQQNSFLLETVSPTDASHFTCPTLSFPLSLLFFLATTLFFLTWDHDSCFILLTHSGNLVDVLSCWFSLSIDKEVITQQWLFSRVTYSYSLFLDSNNIWILLNCGHTHSFSKWYFHHSEIHLLQLRTNALWYFELVWMITFDTYLLWATCFFWLSSSFLCWVWICFRVLFHDFSKREI